MLIKKDTLEIFFGDASYNVEPGGARVYDFASLEKARVQSSAQKLFFAEQVHGVNGVIIDADTESTGAVTYVNTEADFLVTTQKRYALGVVTADCLPVVIFDPFVNALAVIHAGWRGSSQHVVEHALGALQQHYDAEPKHCHVYFGPSGHSCCYEVKQDFLDQITGDKLAQECIVNREGKWFFSLTTYNKRQLEEAGVRPTNISMEHTVCTICSPKYFSYRRDREKAGRQVTYAVIV